MSLPVREQQVLDGIETGLQAGEACLTFMFVLFTRLAGDEGKPGTEELGPQSRRPTRWLHPLHVTGRHPSSLVVEVISPRSGSEQVDRVRKVREYARAGIPLYWIVDLEPEAKVTILTLRGDEYVLETEIRAGHTLTASQPFAISFDPGSLTELE
jgi:Putative restriction endonuclease